MNPGQALLHAANSTTTASSSTLAQLAPLQQGGSTNSTAAASGIVGAVQSFASMFATNASLVTVAVDNAALDIAKAAVVLLVIVGVLLWFTRVNRRLGKDLVEGGVFIMIFIELVLPYLQSFHY
ncbi:MAG TPA: hypothetical protein VLU99_06455 [Nitrososphaerales archaeon]|nr:hypothetical protein [Nitrososphaerales archaeon]